MGNQTKPAYRTNPVHYRLYHRFYSNGTALVEAAASSHWQECARHFEVWPIGEDHFELAGYGFGSSGSGSLRARVFAWAGNALHLAYLGLPGLRQDVREAKGAVKRMGLAFS